MKEVKNDILSILYSNIYKFLLKYSFMDNIDLEEGLELNIQFDKCGGLVPAVAQELSGEIYMLGYVNKEALNEALRSGYATFWSRKRKELWKKGETSGDLFEIVEIRVDCDQDAILYLGRKVKGGLCHTRNSKGESRRTCFYRRITNGRLEFIDRIE